MQLQLCTWPEVEAYLQRSTGIIIPIGSTEQHGPNGLLGTDAICPETIARGVSQQIEVMIAPTLSIGMAQHHLGFPGTISLRPTTLLLVIADIIGSLLQHGFNRLYFLNGHGGNVATVNAAFSEVYANTTYMNKISDGARLRCRLVNWWTMPAVQRLSESLFGEAEGSHATPSEVSLSFFACPDSVKTAPMSPRIAPRGEIFDAADFRARFPDGRIGSDPSRASIAAGERLYRAAVSDIAESYRVFLDSP